MAERPTSDLATTAPSEAGRSGPARARVGRPGPMEPLDVGLDDIESVKRRCHAFREIFATLRREVAGTIVGQEAVVEQTLWALFADGHILLEGVPGLGKTLLVRTLGAALSLHFSRIQFTPDLMPADITGTTIVVDDPVTRKRSMAFRPGPIFAQIVLADEINRATPKSQAALLEAMQERSVTVAGETRKLERPFLVMATQNPIEQEGTYALPEAQLDRFLLKITVPYAGQRDLAEILKRTTSSAVSTTRPILDSVRILQAQRLARHLLVPPFVQDYAIRLVLATHPTSDACPAALRQLISVGVSPRGAQAIVSTARIRALIDGRYNASCDDVASVVFPALRHRVMRSFEAEADGVTTDDIIRGLLSAVPRPGETARMRGV